MFVGFELFVQMAKTEGNGEKGHLMAMYSIREVLAAKFASLLDYIVSKAGHRHSIGPNISKY